MVGATTTTEYSLFVVVFPCTCNEVRAEEFRYHSRGWDDMGSALNK